MWGYPVLLLSCFLYVSFWILRLFALQGLQCDLKACHAMCDAMAGNWVRTLALREALRGQNLELCITEGRP